MQGIWDRELLVALAKMLFATLVMSVAVLFLHHFLNTHASGRFAGKLAAVLIPLGTAIPIYLGLSFLLKIKDAHFLLGKFFKPRKN